MIIPIFQESTNDCGLACIAMIACHHGLNVTVRQLAGRVNTHGSAMTAHDIVQLADEIKVNSRVLRLEPHELEELKTPCILHWKMNHFVVLESASGSKIVIVDPAYGRKTISHAVLSESFTGVALELTPSEAFVPKKISPAISLTSLVRGLKDERAALSFIILMVAILETVTLVMPLISQVVIDGAITSHDKDFLLVAAMGGILLVLCQFALSVLSEVAKLKLNQRIGLKWTSNLFSHLIRLPLSYFQGRQLGEISSRFSALRPIKDFLLTITIGITTDFIVLICAGIFMGIYSITLLGVVIVACLGYASTQAIFYPFLRNATAERLVLSANEHAFFLESIRSVLTLKMLGNTAYRCSRWNSMIVDVQNRDTATQKIHITASGVNTLIFGVESMCVLYIAGGAIIESQMSIGMLVAFIGFKGNFTSRFSKMVNIIIDWCMQSVHCDRLADIALQDPENVESHYFCRDDTPVKIELINVSFRHSPLSPWILRDINLTLSPGEHLAIVGRSGSGKSTLAKIILGVLQPSRGQVLINGIKSTDFGTTHLRTITGTVLQEDQVLAGSISENISGFDLNPCMQRIQNAAKSANFHAIVNKLPMGYLTVISDGCSTLSSGQRQRLFLARALYKTPKLLLLDEAINNLDLHSEQHIISSLKMLSCTIVIIAHRRESLTLASRFIELERGEIANIFVQAS
ncbi:peptidase domain-containing ABC transporter [Pseudomonas sp. LP_7_YM]|uniref:peptidase domain-containing ABC transporter n=1 Tax=Pseudomonas sp. LP_7_YM TaxID=2485137 RepID=UPI0010DB5AE4|nr:peptidase domain-containing ABC transporter [Pseudomonas sp. LP_7_YM]TDV59395.1 ATP-binding cassette subfamily B protein RaxB [Pseudomonas sp. LP_7_YM]